MPLRDRLTVLISEPGASSAEPYYPSTWAILKTHAETASDIGPYIDWLDPLFVRGPVDRMLQSVRGRSIDMLGLSCYIWNFDLQCEIARITKAANPSCLVVAGGPEPDHADPGFFQRHPYIDVVVIQDGEIPFAALLTQQLRNHGDLSAVPGLCLPDPVSRVRTYTGSPQVPTDFGPSPYLTQNAFLSAVAHRYDGTINAVWETTRGCPYSCSFCDWGSSTMSKVRRIDMDRVAAEADWIARNRTMFVFLADANFGILPRDPEIAEVIAAAHRRHGYPRFLYYSPAKNNPERAVMVARTLSEAGVSQTHYLAIQHTNPDVLAATERSNIPPAKQVEVVRQLLERGVPVSVQLIVGIPGDTYDRWKGCFADLMEWGVHDDYMAFPYHLLPNAPAADPAFRAKWGVRTAERWVAARQETMRPEGAPDLLLKARLIVETTSFSEGDWARMRTYAGFVRALHNGCLTRLIAQHLRCTHGVSYRAFYEHLIEEGFGAHPVHRAVLDCYTQFAREPEAFEDLPLPEIPEFGGRVEAGRWAFVRLCLDIDRVFETLAACLGARYANAPNLNSVVQFQRDMLILPSYDRDAGKTFTTDRDWLAYFAAIGRQTTAEALPEPSAAPAGQVVVRDRSNGNPRLLHLPLDWNTLEGTARIARWIDRVVIGRSASTRTLFQDVSYADGPPDPTA